MRIKDLREDNDITQKEIAEYLHIKQNTYSQYENGQRQLPIDALIALAKFYNTSTDYILGLTNETKPYKKQSPEFIAPSSILFKAYAFCHSAAFAADILFMSSLV